MTATSSQCSKKMSGQPSVSGGQVCASFFSMWRTVS